MANLEQLIEERTAKIALIGLGYVGLPLAIEFAKVGFKVIGIDIDAERVACIVAGNRQTYIPDVQLPKDIIDNKRLWATLDYSVLVECDVIIICVPTPLRKTKEPDVSHILYAAKEIQRYLKKGDKKLIVLESTTYPGMTDEILLPLFEDGIRRIGEDFHLCFSPERIDPANKEYNLTNIPKIVSGITPKCRQLCAKLYAHIIKDIIQVSSTRTAEIVKLLENTFRVVNIALANEFALICEHLKVDVWEVIDAAATKPFGFMPFYPGPGLGGHCIPIDPLYLSWKARLEGIEPKFIALADQINSYMPYHVVNLIMDALNHQGKCLLGAKILVTGVTYKRDVADIRESPAHVIIPSLMKKGAKVLYYDPYVDKFELSNGTLFCTQLSAELLTSVDCTVILTDHSTVDYTFLVNHSKLIVDARGVTRYFKDKSKIFSI